MKTTLLKLDANKQIREWSIWIEPSGDTSCSVIILTGVSSKGMTRHTLPFTPENHRRLIPNSESPLEAAKTEMKRRITKQKQRHGYAEKLVYHNISPMLAYPYKAHAHKLPQRVFIQPKLNGVRCLASAFWLKSRKDTYFNLPHIQKALAQLPPDIVLDGELYIHGSNLQTIMGLSSRIGFDPECARLEYHVFDIVESSATFTQRHELLKELPSLSHPIHIVNTLDIKTKDIDEHFEYFIKNDYEGAIIRTPQGKYHGGTRSDELLKYKKAQQTIGKIIDVLPMEKRQYLAKLHVATGHTRFFCSIKGSEDFKRHVLRNKSQYINHLCTIEFEDYSDDNVPLKPICTQIHG